MKKLSFAEIESVLFGSLYNEEKDGFLIPHRFMPWQEALFEETVNYINKPLKTNATASATLDFCTDAENLLIEGRFVTASSRYCAYIDLYVDGVMREHLGYEAAEEREVSFSVPLGKGEKRVTVYLPNLFGFHLRTLAHDGGFLNPYEKKRKMLIVGDSITHGYTSAFPSLSYANIIARRLDAEAVNQAIGGAVFEACDIERGIDFVPDFITVAYGTNDWSHGRDIETCANEYFSALRKLYPEAHIFAILPIWRGDVAKKKEAKIPFPEASEILRRVCDGAAGVTVVDGDALVPHFPAFFTEDLLHPNELGFYAYGTALADILEARLREGKES